MKFKKVVSAALGLSVALATSFNPAWANVVNDWDAIAANAIITIAGTGPAPTGVFLAYLHLAMYDAVNSIDRGHQPYVFSTDPPAGANADAAAVAAAHDILVHYFSSQQATFDAAESASIAAISDTPNDIAAGESVGQASASALIQARANDGLLANVPYTPGSGPGVWQPTPPALLPAAAPWLSQMTPFTMSAPDQFRPKGPYKLSSKEWIRDYNEVQSLGSLNSATRTDSQTEIGLFWVEHPTQQYARAFRGLVVQEGLDTPDTARLTAMLWTGYADALIGCWDAKFTYNFWRPITAIRAGGGNPKLTGDPNWTSLSATPNHPEYPSAHGCATGAVTDILAAFFDTHHVHFVVNSLVTNTTHTFDNTNDIDDEVAGARIYAGFHYRHSVKDGRTLGGKVARHLVSKFFREIKNSGK